MKVELTKVRRQKIQEMLEVRMDQAAVHYPTDWMPCGNDEYEIPLFGDFRYVKAKLQNIPLLAASAREAIRKFDHMHWKKSEFTHDRFHIAARIDADTEWEHKTFDYDDDPFEWTFLQAYFWALSVHYDYELAEPEVEGF